MPVAVRARRAALWQRRPRASSLSGLFERASESASDPAARILAPASSWPRVHGGQSPRPRAGHVRPGPACQRNPHGHRASGRSQHPGRSRRAEADSGRPRSHPASGGKAAGRRANWQCPALGGRVALERARNLGASGNAQHRDSGQLVRPRGIRAAFGGAPRLTVILYYTRRKSVPALTRRLPLHRGCRASACAPVPTAALPRRTGAQQTQTKPCAASLCTSLLRCGRRGSCTVAAPATGPLGRVYVDAPSLRCHWRSYALDALRNRSTTGPSTKLACFPLLSCLPARTHARIMRRGPGEDVREPRRSMRCGPGADVGEPGADVGAVPAKTWTTGGASPNSHRARRRAASTVAGLERCLPYPEYLLPT
jgi:hypothetical protein